MLIGTAHGQVLENLVKNRECLLMYPLYKHNHKHYFLSVEKNAP